MKPFLLCIALLLWLSPQKNNAKSNHEHTEYLTLTAGAGILTFHNTPGQMSISFPYTITDASGNISHQTFQSRTINGYTRPTLMGDINLGVGTLKNAITFGVHPTREQAYIYAGYGRNFYFDLSSRQQNAAEDRMFVIKPSINVAVTEYAHAEKQENDDNYLGSIDNENETISLLGHISGPTFSYKSNWTNWPYITTTTSDSKSLDLYYAQIDWVIIPEITLSDNPYKHLFRWELNMGYHIPVHENGGIQIFQNGWNKMKPGINGLAENGAVTTFNQQLITASPYKLTGFFLSATIGFNLSWKTIEKLH